MPHPVSRAALSLFALGLVACGNEDSPSAAASGSAAAEAADAQATAAFGSVEWSLNGQPATLSVDNALVNSSTPGLYYIRIDANPPEGAPTRYGPVLSLSFQLIHTAASTTTRTALLSYDPRGPGTGWWSGRAGPESQIALTIDHANDADGRLSLSGHISGRLISRSDDGATTAPVEARFSIEAEVGE
jgi:hypothetical protein